MTQQNEQATRGWKQRIAALIERSIDRILRHGAASAPFAADIYFPYGPSGWDEASIYRSMTRMKYDDGIGVYR